MSPLFPTLLGRTASRKSRPNGRSARPALEYLNDRILPSTTGNFSQVLDTHGNSVVFFIDRQHNLWETANGGAAVEIDGSGKDNAVSAGLDKNGYAAPYVHNFDGTLWELADFGYGRQWREMSDGVSLFAAGNDPNQLWYVRYGAGWAANPQGGYFFEIDAGSGSTGGAVLQISPGQDESGNVVSYLLKADGNVYKCVDYSGQTRITAVGGYTEIAGSVNGLVYALNSGGAVWMYNTWSGTLGFVAAGVSQISAGTDFWGNSTVDMMQTSDVMQYNTATGNFKQISGRTAEMSAGEGGHDFYTDSYNQLHDHADQWYFTLHGAREYVTDTVIGYNVL